MDSPFMENIAEKVGELGIEVVRFEFSYMAMRREDGKKRPPSSQKKLLAEWTEVWQHFAHRPFVAIGGKSMGGRMASMLADSLKASALVCLGYPFHPPGKPEKLRTEHLLSLNTPTLFLQGERDPFGNANEVPDYRLSESIHIQWMPDGDHSLKPRKKSGRTEAQSWQEAAEAIAQFLKVNQSKHHQQ